MIIGEKMNKLLQQETVEYIVHELINPETTMLNLFDKQNNGGEDNFRYASSKRSAETDILAGILGEPVELTEGSEFPQVSFSGIQEESGNMTKLGFEVEFSSELVASDRNLAFVRGSLRDMAYTMKRVINRFAFTELMNSAEAPTITLGNGSWASGTNDKIDQDVKKMQRAFVNQEKYKNKYHLTNMYLSQNSYWGAQDYYDAILNGGFNSDNVRGSIMRSSEEFDSGLLGIDANAQPATWYYNVNKEDNAWNDPNDPHSSIINVNRFENDDKHPKSLGFQMYVMLGLAVNKEMAVLYQPGV